MDNSSIKKNEEDNIKIKYIFSDDYNAKYASGVYGGVTPSGEIVANFFFERHGLPISQVHTITPSNELGPVIQNEPEDLPQTMVRVVENGIILNVKFAEVLINWLTDNVKQAKVIANTQKETNK
jgi:hypothetical protein